MSKVSEINRIVYDTMATTEVNARLKTAERRRVTGKFTGTRTWKSKYQAKRKSKASTSLDTETMMKNILAIVTIDVFIEAAEICRQGDIYTNLKTTCEKDLTIPVPDEMARALKGYMTYSGLFRFEGWLAFPLKTGPWDVYDWAITHR